ncbi:MAG: methyltransferase type 11 [Chloroflexi bacterium RBG_16_57_8]|nr:MAG: methyltransferase type 11 [Chloroflexi bacterium RBG_16_57_8]
MPENALFDEWPERYDRWFTTPIGRLVRQTEGELISELLAPKAGESVLDAGCGTAVFTLDILGTGAEVVGLDISGRMLEVAGKKAAGCAFFPVQADMQFLPFRDSSFDKTISVTALEFVADARAAADELFRVTRPGGTVVVATLNSLSPWATRRQAKAQSGQRHILEDAHYRSPSDLLALSPFPGVTKTAVHFQNDDDPDKAMDIERTGRLRGLDTGAFVAVRWQMPPG